MKKIGIYIGTGLITIYQVVLRPFVIPTCRYEPTCSVYSKQAIERFGLWRGGILAGKRIISCHPFSKKDTYDPVPEQENK